jgi:hypothetical protein
MTENGLSRNFEVGFLVNSQTINDRSFKGGYQAVTERIRALWTFLMNHSEPVTEELLEAFRQIEKKAESTRVDVARLEDEFMETVSEVPFIRYQRNSLNPQNVTNDLRSTNIFEGFKATDWAIFDHKRELNESNLTQFRKELDEKINPLLRSFYLRLKYEPIFKKGFGSLDTGFSANLQLKQRFPSNRYMYLTKQRQGKAKRKHIAEASIIIGIGKEPKTENKLYLVEDLWTDSPLIIL